MKRLSGADPDGFDVDELTDAEGAQFATVARSFYPAEGETRV